MVTIRQKPIIHSQTIKEAEYTTTENHPSTNVGSRREKKEQWNYKTTRKQLIVDIIKFLHINNYLRCKWIEVFNQKTQNGWVE